MRRSIDRSPYKRGITDSPPERTVHRAVKKLRLFTHIAYEVTEQRDKAAVLDIADKLFLWVTDPRMHNRSDSQPPTKRQWEAMTLLARSIRLACCNNVGAADEENSRHAVRILNSAWQTTSLWTPTLRDWWVLPRTVADLGVLSIAQRYRSALLESVGVLQSMTDDCMQDNPRVPASRAASFLMSVGRTSAQANALDCAQACVTHLLGFAREGTDDAEAFCFLALVVSAAVWEQDPLTASLLKVQLEQFARSGPLWASAAFGRSNYPRDATHVDRFLDALKTT